MALRDSCRQAQGGGRAQKPFPYTIPQIMEDTGLCPRAISKAISRLDKLHLILSGSGCCPSASPASVGHSPTSSP